MILSFTLFIYKSVTDFSFVLKRRIFQFSPLLLFSLIIFSFSVRFDILFNLSSLKYVTIRRKAERNSSEEIEYLGQIENFNSREWNGVSRTYSEFELIFGHLNIRTLNIEDISKEINNKLEFILS